MRPWARLCPDAPPWPERPVARGTIEDVDNGPVVAVDWLIDSGAIFATVRPDLADQIPDAWKSPPAIEVFGWSTTGGAIALYVGPEIAVETENGPPARLRGWVGLKDTNTGSNLLGMDVISGWGGRIAWNPAAETGFIMF